jgi:hypothetical protein
LLDTQILSGRKHLGRIHVLSSSLIELYRGDIFKAVNDYFTAEDGFWAYFDRTQEQLSS